MGKILSLLAISIAFLSSSAPLRIGMELSYPPFEMICQDGGPCGISVDIIHSMGKFMERQVEIINLPFVGLIPSLQNRTIDAVMSSLTITEQRKKVIDFSDPYAITGLCLLLAIDTKLETIEQAKEKGSVIVVKSGTSGEIYARAHLQEATVRVLDKEAACVLEVIQGKADAFIYDQLSVYANWKKNSTTTRANLVPFQKEYWAIGVRKGESAFVDQINQFIKKFRADGGFDRLAEKYLPGQRKAFAEMGVPFVF